MHRCAHCWAGARADEAYRYRKRSDLWAHIAKAHPEQDAARRPHYFKSSGVAIQLLEHNAHRKRRLRQRRKHQQGPRVGRPGKDRLDAAGNPRRGRPRLKNPR